MLSIEAPRLIGRRSVQRHPTSGLSQLATRLLTRYAGETSAKLGVRADVVSLRLVHDLPTNQRISRSSLQLAAKERRVLALALERCRPHRPIRFWIKHANIGICSNREVARPDA